MSGQLKPDSVDTSVPNNADHTLLGPDTFAGWYYQAYRLDGGPPVQGPPPAVLNGVTSGHTVTYLYRRLGVTERFREDGDPAHMFQADQTAAVAASGDPYSAPGWVPGSGFTDSGRIYAFVGYQIDGGPPVYTETLPSPLIAAVTAPRTVTYLYRAAAILHIRQIVLDADTGLETPRMGYFRLDNDGQAMPVTGESGVDNYGLTGYADYKLTPGGDNVFTVYDFIPQYYEYAGHIQNTGAAAGASHDNPGSARPVGSAANGQIALDYGAAGEYWLTVYITPRGAPGDYQWGYATNGFGSVNTLP
jgi:hypothetical protein